MGDGHLGAGLRLGWRSGRPFLLVGGLSQLLHKGLADGGAPVEVLRPVERRIPSIFLQRLVVLRLETLEEIGKCAGAGWRGGGILVEIQLGCTMLGGSPRPHARTGCGRGRGRLRPAGEDLVIQFAQAHQHVLVLEEIIGIGLRLGLRSLLILVLVIVAGEYLIESGINYEGFVLQVLVVLQAGMSAQSAEQILAIVLEGGLLQLLPGAIHSLCRLPEAGGQGLGAATVGQDPLVQGLLLLWLRLCA